MVFEWSCTRLKRKPFVFCMAVAWQCSRHNRAQCGVRSSVVSLRFLPPLPAGLCRSACQCRIRWQRCQGQFCGHPGRGDAFPAGKEAARREGMSALQLSTIRSASLPAASSLEAPWCARCHAACAAGSRCCCLGQGGTPRPGPPRTARGRLRQRRGGAGCHQPGGHRGPGRCTGCMRLIGVHKTGFSLAEQHASAELLTAP